MRIKELFNPEDHGGYANMRLFWFSIAVGAAGFIIKTVYDCFFCETF